MIKPAARIIVPCSLVTTSNGNCFAFAFSLFIFRGQNTFVITINVITINTIIVVVIIKIIIIIISSSISSIIILFLKRRQTLPTFTETMSNNSQCTTGSSVVTSSLKYLADSAKQPTTSDSLRRIRSISVLTQNARMSSHASVG